MGKFWGTVGYFILFSLLLAVQGVAQSPHGDDLKISCDACHTAESWKINQDTLAFNHDTVRFALQGQHAVIDCRACHTTLVFSTAPLDCASCHTDMHQGTVGFDCARCHDSNSWLVNNITELHQEISFPLIGAHAAANCFDCHISDTDLRFDLIGTACVNCHRDDYDATSSPDHKAAGYSTECQECHTITAFEWSASGIDHSFFPLTLGHEINDCAQCHPGPDYASTSPDCFACHLPDYEASVEPNHTVANLPTDCATCHTTNPDWEPAKFTEHDAQFFPIYSGKHEGEWSECRDCHTNSNDYSEFQCITCHTNPETDSHHDNVNGYTYNNPACLACHPTGDSEDNFDHDKTDFPLTGAHKTPECVACHFAGYTGTPTECVACHDKDYQQSVNPDHNELSLSADCVMCHTTDPEWDPAAFPDHNDYYVLAGAHVAIATECASCHNGDYKSTPTTCVGCHIDDYNSTSDPSHVTAQFSTDCAICHQENAWQPATFDHDGQYFPIYSGSHEGEWSECVDCHINAANYAEFTCITCHANPETDENHDGVPGYVYHSPACLACHPNGEGEGFNHNLTAFPLTGAHTTTECLSCHAAGYEGTPTECTACHTPDFEQTTNPNHGAIGLSTDCASCHTTEPGWSPAAFPDHNTYYVVAGAHVPIANECAQCHNGDYSNTPNTCVGCHQADYDQTTDPNHAASLYPTDCIICHNESAWQPSTFDHALTEFPLTGAHTTLDCASCHTAGYSGTPTECAACHIADFEQTINPNHVVIGLSTDCAMCHTTDPEWDPAGFPVHDDYFALQGAHAVIAMECVLCHNGDYMNTPDQCIGCHQNDYDQTLNPSHVSAQFSTDCATCHTENAWVPANFDHDAQYFPIYSGAHEGEWDQCIDCHTNLSNYAEVSCITCHANPETDEQHDGVPGYVYNSPACLACHPTGDGEGLNHDLTEFPLTGAHLNVDCFSCHAQGYNGTPTECAACHITDFEQSTNPNHGALGLSTDCVSCHSTEPGWSPADFPVHNDFYVLQGAHIAIAMECVICHSGDYNNTPNTCVGCHQDDYAGTTDPDHEVSQFPTDCIICHTESAWVPATLDHDLTDFPLTGAHLTVDCASCHANGYTGTPTDCAACHIADYHESINPNHAVLGLSTDCATCHTTNPDWEPADFPVHDEYYVLQGAHIEIAMECVLCHNGDYNNTPNTCVGCHLDDYTGTTDPDHEVLGYPTDCIICHNESAWVPSDFDHNQTDFPLTGAHVSVDCASCHAGGYTGTPTDCAACHIADYNQSTNPDHEVLDLSTDCALCHTTDPEWDPADFPVHDEYYVLQGAHVEIAMECVLCHNGDYNNTPNTCIGCHLDDYTGTTDPDHEVLGYPTDCIICHNESAWVPAEFDHNETDFPLTGAHVTVDCASCHAGGYTGTPTDCAACHIADYNQSTNPDHEVLDLSTDCALCHTTDPEWDPADFPVHDEYYVLQGAHVEIAMECVLCHNGDYNNTPNTCVGCHLDDYNGTTDPDHEVLGYPTDCIICHSETAWVPAEFDHNETDFPLTGAHLIVDCASCHSGGYTGTPTDCAACHIADYNQSTNPDHEVLDLSTDCVLCHTTDPEWNPADFPVHDEYYVLQGAHLDIAMQCVLCHNGDYNNTPNTCVGCHLDEYNATNDPDHEAAQFPTDCILCHNQNAWEPADWDHDGMYFPIYSGKHDGEWDQCSDCHTNSNDFSVFTCLTCHTQGETDADHDEVTGYQYNSDACLACHPDGEN
ncbi:MAG TPA: hypothetical protein VI603_10080 [Saprospiraceae bacterium]|nr:hypothetical protein [Saprospiraceae bacterium]